MATIRKHRSKWQAIVRRKGYPPVVKSFQLKCDAQEWARHIEAQIDRRSLPQDLKILDRITLGDVLKRYRDEVIPKKRCQSREVSLINAYLKRNPTHSALSLSALQPHHLSSYRDERLRQVKPATICRELGLIQHAISIAKKDWGIPIQTNPVAEVATPQRGGCKQGLRPIPDRLR